MNDDLAWVLTLHDIRELRQTKATVAAKAIASHFSSCL